MCMCVCEGEVKICGVCALQYLSVYSTCVCLGVQERLGFGVVRAPTQPPQVGFGQSSNKHQHEFLFSPRVPSYSKHTFMVRK